MSLADDFKVLAASLLAQYGTAATWQVPTQVYNDDGNVTETVLSYTVRLLDFVDESRRYGLSDSGQRATATTYVAANGMPTAPALGHRLIYRGRNWIVVGVQPSSLNGSDIMWRVDVAETGSE